MSEENGCSVAFHGNALAENEPQGARIRRDGDELVSVDRYGNKEAARYSLWAVERVLRGEQAPLVQFHDSQYADKERLLSVQVEGQQYLGFWDKVLYAYEQTGTYTFESADIDEATILREFYPVDELDLCETILEWVERSIEEREEELTYPPEDELSSLYRDATEMVAYYRKHGSLDGFELSRTKPELKRCLFEQERYPRTERYVREHEEVICDVILEFLARDLDSETIEEKLSRSTYTEDWVAVKALECLAEHPADEAIVAQGSFWDNENPEVQRAAARVLAELTHLEEARRYLRYWDDLEDERAREIAREALAEWES